jgi:hypothetical protein
MLSEQLAYELDRLAYYLGIGAIAAGLVIVVICLIIGVRIMLEDDPEYIGYVPLPRRVDSEDQDS